MSARPRFKQRHLENKEEIVTRIIDECIGFFVSSETVQGESPSPAKKLKGLACVSTVTNTKFESSALLMFLRLRLLDFAIAYIEVDDHLPFF